MNRLLFSTLWLLFALNALPTEGLARANEVPADIKQKYAALYQMSVVNEADGGTSFGPARHWVRRGVHVLYLKGDRFEMAFQHGRLMKQEILKGAVPEAAEGLGHSVMQVMGDSLISRIAVKFLYRSITEKMLNYSLENPINPAVSPLMDGYGISEATGISLDDFMKAALSTESTTVLLGKNLSGSTFGRGGSSSHCSSFVSWGKETSDGEMVIGRNTDYWLNGTYDRYPTVIYFNPTDGTQKYMAVSSAGLHNAGVVGINESGIYLDVHTVPTLDVSAESYPVFMIAQEVLRKSKSFDEALKNFAVAKPGAGWTYVLASQKEKKAATIELSHSAMAVRMAKGESLVQTNHYLTPEMQSRFETVNPRILNDTLARYQRISDLLLQNRGKIDERVAASIMADKYDPFAKEVAWLGNTVAVNDTMTSAVVQTGKNRIFVANGTAPVSLNEYVELPLVTLDPQTFAKARFDTVAQDNFKTQYPEKAAAEQFYIQAKIAYENELDNQKSIQFLKKALEKDPSALGASFVLGILSIKIGDEAAAENYLLHITEGKDPHFRLLGHYYLGRLYASQGQRKDAAAQLQKIIEIADPKVEAKLIAAAEAGLKKIGWKRWKFGLMDLPLMFQQADMVSYK